MQQFFRKLSVIHRIFESVFCWKSVGRFISILSSNVNMFVPVILIQHMTHGIKSSSLQTFFILFFLHSVKSAWITWDIIFVVFLWSKTPGSRDFWHLWQRFYNCGPWSFVFLQKFVPYFIRYDILCSDSYCTLAP